MIQTNLKDSIYTISLNRPEKRNALNSELLKMLLDAVKQAAQKADVRILVIKGNGNVFCAGADLDFIRHLSDSEVSKEFAGILSELLEKIRSFPCPVVVEVQGASMGGANGILAAADIVIADINTRFAFSEVKLGLLPAVISPYVLTKLSMSRAFDLLLTGRMFDATEAKHAGLVTYTANENELDFLFRQTINQILSCAPVAIMHTRKLIWDHVLKNDWQKSLEISRELFVKSASSAEAKEGIAAFFEKRNPSWSGNGTTHIR